MRLTRRRALFLLLVPAAGLAAFFAIRSIVFSQINSAIAEKIQSLKSAGYDVRYDSLSFNWRTNVIEVHQLLLEGNRYDTACLSPEFVLFGKIRGENLAVFTLIFQNVLRFENVYLDGLRINMRQNSQRKPDSSSQREKDFTLQIDRAYLRSAEFTYSDSVQCELISGIKSDLTIDNLTMDFLTGNPFAYQANWLSLYATEIALPKSLYTFKIKKSKLNFSEQVLRLDSVQIIPDGGKVEFGRKHGFEIDRYDALIPFLQFENFSFSLTDSSAIKASMAEVQFYLKVFRDKRLPFVKRLKLLPVAMLQDLPVSVKIDSLKIRKSYVQYEEYVAGASESGKVYFDNLYASIYNINNRLESGSIQLRAQANLQGQGKIDLAAIFPLEKNKRARLSGSISNFEIAVINSMLVPSTNIKVESGKMEKLSFDFSFNRVRSDGEIALQYQDLKLIMFKEEVKEKGDAAEKDNLKTFITNTFILRTNMNEDLPVDKRTGTVAFVRDNNRSIFNFWVKSVVSGIKSAYKLDEIETRKTEKEIKKEQRLSRREARRQKRAEKKRERG